VSSGYIQARDGPGPTEILQALRQALSDNSRLKRGAPTEEIATQLIIGGYLQEKPSLTLVEEMLEVLEAGGLGLRSPTLQPCSLEFFWDDDRGGLGNIDLSMSIEWVGAPDMWEERTVPEKLTHARTHSCTDLITNPAGVLQNKERWPIHVCYEEFLRQSTELWAQTQALTVDSLNVYRWASMYPLPVGRRALMANREVSNPSEWSEVLNVLPFEEYEKAVWALRVEDERSLASRSILDLFGLAEYPSEFHKEFGIPVGGDLAYVLRARRGRDTSLTDLVDNAERWWSQFRGRALRGRPRGSGTWKDADEFREAARNVVGMLRERGYKPTQERVAEVLNCNDRVLRYWIKRYGPKWNDILKAT
jgi:hypothetical protein